MFSLDEIHRRLTRRHLCVYRIFNYYYVFILYTVLKCLRIAWSKICGYTVTVSLRAELANHRPALDVLIRESYETGKRRLGPRKRGPACEKLSMAPI